MPPLRFFYLKDVLTCRQLTLSAKTPERGISRSLNLAMKNYSLDATRLLASFSLSLFLAPSQQRTKERDDRNRGYVDVK